MDSPAVAFNVDRVPQASLQRSEIEHFTLTLSSSTNPMARREAVIDMLSRQTAAGVARWMNTLSSIEAGTSQRSGERHYVLPNPSRSKEPNTHPNLTQQTGRFIDGRIDLI